MQRTTNKSRAMASTRVIFLMAIVIKGTFIATPVRSSSLSPDDGADGISYGLFSNQAQAITVPIAGAAAAVVDDLCSCSRMTAARPLTEADTAPSLHQPEARSYSPADHITDHACLDRGGFCVENCAGGATADGGTNQRFKSMRKFGKFLPSGLLPGDDRSSCAAVFQGQNIEGGERLCPSGRVCCLCSPDDAPDGRHDADEDAKDVYEAIIDIDVAVCDTICDRPSDSPFPEEGSVPETPSFGSSSLWLATSSAQPSHDSHFLINPQPSCHGYGAAGMAMRFDWDQGQVRSEYTNSMDVYTFGDKPSCRCSDKVYLVAMARGVGPTAPAFSVLIDDYDVYHLELNNAATSILYRLCVDVTPHALRGAFGLEDGDEALLQAAAFAGGAVPGGAALDVLASNAFLEGLGTLVSHGMTPVGGIDVERLRQFARRHVSKGYTALGALAGLMAAASSREGLARPGANAVAYVEALAGAYRALERAGQNMKALAYGSAKAYVLNEPGSMDLVDLSRAVVILDTDTVSQVGMPRLTSRLMQHTIAEMSGKREDRVTRQEDLVRLAADAGVGYRAVRSNDWPQRVADWPGETSEPSELSHSLMYEGTVFPPSDLLAAAFADAISGALGASPSDVFVGACYLDPRKSLVVFYAVEVTGNFCPGHSGPHNSQDSEAHCDASGSVHVPGLDAAFPFYISSRMVVRKL